MTSTKALLALTLLLSLTPGINGYAKNKTQKSNLAAGEPAFCDLKTFRATEIIANEKGLKNNHTYKIGGLVLVGLAVGNSKVPATQALANQFSRFAPEEKSCTWYYNNGNAEAEKQFNHRYVSSPILKGVSIAKEYEKVLASSFSDDPVSFASCAVDHGYLAMGCDGMHHRGPSVFAMFLSYAGCSPAHAVAIANKVWGNNFVSTKTREAIAARGQALGDKNPQVRTMLQTLMAAQ